MYKKQHFRALPHLITRKCNYRISWWSYWFKTGTSLSPTSSNQIMSLKNSSNPNNLKREYIYGSIHKNGRRSFRSLDNHIKEYELAASTVYRYSSKEQWKDQRIAFRAELSEEIKKARKHDIFVSLTISKWTWTLNFMICR